jgi:uncharacterized RDD family membrane protein YckC
MAEARAPKVRTPLDETRRFSRSLVTPEGVDLGVRIASAGERAGAFVIDALIIIFTIVIFTMIVGYVNGDGSWDANNFIMIVWLIGFFIIRNFYFVLFEMGARAATPGKRLFKIRVASRGGGLLRADAIFARNAMREVEVFLPMSFLLSGGSQVDGLIVLAGFIWTAVFIFFPLFNRDRLRAGDIIAGTWVVQTPRKALLSDLATRTAAEAPAASVAAMFTAEQLDAYGIKELHVLEDVIRTNKPDAIALVADRIRKKILWTRAKGEADGQFLRDYYAALRGHLESRLLMGVRRTDKHDKTARR